ncbi:hypothetical protein [Methyloversatilis sp.]|uniref:hypothetical protein n=1 Tax=Methyloversatilis sp. TaxID=2569862 RepID=UPI0027B98658|nr:hypothetical protein [Methyloversatilis sp.]
MIPPHMKAFGELAGSMSRSVHGAASTFTQIVSEQVGMSVSHVELADRARLDLCLASLDSCLCGVAQRMRTTDGCGAEAMLVLPQIGGLALVRRMLGLPGDVAEPGELEQDALAEVGNIVIDACSGVLAGALGWHIEAAQPRVTLSVPDRLFGVDETLRSALVTHLRMHLSGLRVDGLVVLEMTALAGLPMLPPRRLDA